MKKKLIKTVCIILLILVLLCASFLLVQLDYAGQTESAQAVSITGVLLIGIILLVLSSALDEKSKRKEAIKRLGIYLLIGVVLAIIAVKFL